MKKTIFISAFQSFVSRNILNTGVLDELLSRGVRVVLFVLPAKETFYKETYTNPNIIVEPFDPEKYADRGEGFFRNLAEVLINTNVIRYRQIKKLQNSGRYFSYFYHRAIIAFLGNLPPIKKFFRLLDSRFNGKDTYEQYFEKYKPDRVFAPDVFGLGDVFLLKSAKKHGVYSVGMVASWDNNTTKGLMRVVPDHLLVQNEIIKDESITIQNVPETLIRVVGIAHYDFYKKYQPVSREEYFRRIGADPNKRLIMFAPAGDKFISTDWQICEIIKRAYTSSKIPSNVVTLIRVHPTNTVSFRDFVPDKHFIVEVPGVKFEGLGDKRKELDKEALYHLLDTLAHVELVINVVSSMVIDAAVFDVPVITIAFEGWEKKVPFGNSIRRYHSDENMAKLLKIGGTAVVKSSEELIEWINKYLDNPKIDQEGRRKITERQCWKLDGQAKNRITDAILHEDSFPKENGD